MLKIFVSYRHTTGGHAGRLCADLAKRLGRNSVFRDAVSIPGGADFRESIDAELERCDVLVVVIDPSWTEDRRIFADDDYVRYEVRAALRRNIGVIPARVDHAKPLREEDVPSDIKELVYRKSLDLSDESWDDDLRGVLSAIRALDKDVLRRRRLLLALGAVVVIAAGGFALWRLNPDPSPVLAASAEIECGFARPEVTAWLPLDPAPVKAVVEPTSEGCRSGFALQLSLPGPSGDEGAGAFADLLGPARTWTRARELHALVRSTGATRSFGSIEIYALSSDYECACSWWDDGRDVRSDRWTEVRHPLSHCTAPAPSKCAFDLDDVDQWGIKLHNNLGEATVQVGKLWVE